jgi:hypothetical protein
MLESVPEVEDMKLILARRQLGMALHLFMQDYDPVSVHCLACAAGELLDKLAKHRGARRFANQILENHPSIQEKELLALRNKYWNAFKHFDDRNGKPRNDVDLWQEFSDENNDHTLIIATIDYFHIANKSPIAFQVFEVWYYALYSEKVVPDTDLAHIEETFPSLSTADRFEQKRRLRRVYEKWEMDRKSRSHPQVDTDALAFRNPKIRISAFRKLN